MCKERSLSFIVRVWKDNENRMIGQIENILTRKIYFFEGLESFQTTLENLLEEKKVRLDKLTK